MRNGADVLVGGLAHFGVRDLFGMPGSHSTTIYDAISRMGSIRTILTRNEQAGAFAADGYARVTGRPGVVCTTAGPGATNALTGIAECWADSVPALLLAGQVNAATIDRECGNYHEIDLDRIFQPVTKWCGTVRRLEEIPAFLGRAFQAINSGRRRPAALFLPQDLMRDACPVDADPPDIPPEPPPTLPRTRSHGLPRSWRRRSVPSFWPAAACSGRRGRSDRDTGPAAGRAGCHLPQWQGRARRAQPAIAGPCASARAGGSYRTQPPCSRPAADSRKS